jgi:hypothetical protein
LGKGWKAANLLGVLCDIFPVNNPRQLHFSQIARLFGCYLTMDADFNPLLDALGISIFNAISPSPAGKDDYTKPANFIIPKFERFLGVRYNGFYETFR